MDEQNNNDCSGGHFVVQDIFASPMGESLHKLTSKATKPLHSFLYFGWTICVVRAIKAKARTTSSVSTSFSA